MKLEINKNSTWTVNFEDGGITLFRNTGEPFNRQHSAKIPKDFKYSEITFAL